MIWNPIVVYSLLLSCMFAISIESQWLSATTPLKDLNGFRASINRNTQRPSCSSNFIRREWRQLNSIQQQSYINAVRCLQTRPSLLDAGATHYDDFVRVHMDQDTAAHRGPRFLHWHRAYLVAFERALRNCTGDYRLTIPYWDSHLDSQAPEDSPIWRSFGGDGDGSDSCVTTGPFVNWRPRYGPGKSTRCLTRSWRIRQVLNPPEVATLVKNEPYDTFRNATEIAHGVVHIWVGGDMENLHSPNDPIFFLHHANIDRVWTEYQVAYASRADEYPERFSDHNVDLRILGPYLGVNQVHPVSSFFYTAQWCYGYSNSVVPNVERDRRSNIRNSSTPSTPQQTSNGRNHQQDEWDNNGRIIIRQGTLKKRTLISFGTRSNSFNQNLMRPENYGQPHGSPFNKITPASNNRDDLYNLRIPIKLSEKFIRWRGLDPKQIRKYENMIADYVSYINTVDGYISDAALVYRTSPILTYRDLGDEEYLEKIQSRNKICEVTKNGLGLTNGIKGVLKTMSNNGQIEMEQSSRFF